MRIQQAEDSDTNETGRFCINSSHLSSNETITNFTQKAFLLSLFFFFYFDRLVRTFRSRINANSRTLRYQLLDKWIRDDCQDAYFRRRGLHICGMNSFIIGLLEGIYRIFFTIVSIGQVYCIDFHWQNLYFYEAEIKAIEILKTSIIVHHSEVVKKIFF